jgi:non-specific serine/threonine protein kinase
LIYEFGEFQFEPGNARLSRRGVVLHAEPKALHVLAVLIESKEALVDRDTLLNRVWGRVIVTPGTLTRLIAELRRLLGDDSLKPRFIETVHTKGYRWIARVSSSQTVTSRSGPPQRSIQLIGLDEDLTRLQVIASTSRLLTLAGPGGTGKTQLALELARRLEVEKPQSVVWIDLTAASDERALPGLVATALDVQLPPGVEFGAGIARAIGDRELLLLFDNCEHLVRTLAADVRTILARCPRVAIVCTSQATLDLPEETVFWVSPLKLPSPDWEASADPVASLLDSSAVRLLRDRAHAVTPHFELTRDNASSVVEICRRLDGLPLALELAAARLTVLTPRQLLAALDDRFTLLARQAGGADRRHGSLRHAIEWSYELLEERERDLLDCFGVFVGTWSLDAALAVAGGQEQAGATLNGLQSLVQKSLVIVERAPRGLRYRLLDSVRAFACARLDTLGRAEQVRLLHAQYFARLAGLAGEQLLEEDQVVWMDHLDSEWSNLRAAWEWLQVTPARHAEAVQVLTGLRWHFWIRGRYAEALQWYREGKEVIEACSSAEQARLLNGHAIAQLHAARLDDATDLARRAADCAEASGLEWEHGYALSVQAWLAAVKGHEAETERNAARVAELCRHLAQPWMEAFGRLGKAFNHVYALRHEQATRAMQDVAEGFDRAHDAHMRMFVAIQVGLQHFLMGDHAGARRSLLKALDLSRRIANPRAYTGVCETSAYIAVREGNPELAARLLGGAEAGRLMSGAPLFPYWVKPHEEAWSEVCAALGTTTAQDLFNAGKLAGSRDSAQVAVVLLRPETAGH